MFSYLNIMTLNTLCSLTDEALVFIEAQLKGALNSSSSRIASLIVL